MKGRELAQRVTAAPSGSGSGLPRFPEVLLRVWGGFRATLGNPVSRAPLFGLVPAFILILLWLGILPDPLIQVPAGTLILDRNGEILDARINPQEQWQFAAGSRGILQRSGANEGQLALPGRYRRALIYFEDKNFESHPGIDIGAVARASFQNLAAGRVVSGASTITMQLARLVLGSRERGLGDKIVEALAALRLETLYTKDEILRLYADLAPFGGNIVGIEAASRLYFGRSPEDLSWAEAALLAVLPKNPSQLHLSRNRDALLERRDSLLRALAAEGEFDELGLESALLEPLPGEPRLPDRVVPGLYSRANAEGYAGSTITTTIDGNLQRRGYAVVERHASELYKLGIRNLAVLVLNLRSYEVAAYYGNTPLSAPDILGADVDIVMSLRSTGSLLKPFLYAAMQDSGDMFPTELLPDTPTRYGSYSPQNHNKQFLGAVPANMALTMSLNAPFVHALSRFGIQRFLMLANDLGITTFTRPAEDYGLTLIIGGGESSLWQISSAFGSLTRLTTGAVFRDTAITRPRLWLEDGAGDFSRGASSGSAEGGAESGAEGAANTAGATGTGAAANPRGTRSPISAAAWSVALAAMQDLVRPGIDAGWQTFYDGSPISWKTGTSQGFRDAWAIGMSPDYLVGVWAGNAEGPGTAGLQGTFTAAPVMLDMFRLLGRQQAFDPDPGLLSVQVSRASGFLPHPQETDTVPVRMTAASERSGRINPWFDPARPAGAQFVLPANIATYYARWNPEYARNMSLGRTPSLGILVPQPGTRFVLPVDYGGEEQNAVLEAWHSEEGAQLFWHLDGRFLGTTRSEHTMRVRPEPGSHSLVIVDSWGNTRSAQFEVSLTEAGERPTPVSEVF